MSQTNEERRVTIQEHERQEPSKEALERLARVVTRLKGEGVPVNEHLPVIEDSHEAKTRSADEIAKRAIGVFLPQGSRFHQEPEPHATGAQRVFLAPRGLLGAAVDVGLHRHLGSSGGPV